MKVCASCGASLPDGAAFCIACGSKEFKSEFMPDLDAPQPEKPKIEYDQYGRPIGQQFAQQQYEQPHFSESYEDQYEQKFSDQVDHPQFLEGYQSSGYSQSQSYDTPQYIEGYQPQYSQQYQQYQQPAYDDSQQYQQRSVYEQSQQYQQQPVYEEPQQYQQPVVPEPEPDPKPVEKEFDPYQAAKENSNKVDPHEAAKNFKPEPVVIKTEGKKQIVLFFDLAKDTLNKNELAHLHAFASKLSPDAKLKVTGSADSGTGNEKINTKLSTNRAQLVVDILTKQYGIPLENIEVDHMFDLFGNNPQSRAALVE